MKISEVFGLSLSPYELDFVDVDIDEDCPLFVDPFLISNINSQWAIQTDKVIKSFFNEFKNAMILKDYDKAKSLFLFMSEPKENCLGISKKGTMNGRGVGELNTQKIVNKIIESNAIEQNLVNNIEDISIFVEDIDKDKISDMVTNIIRKKLIDYTNKQCDMWNIELTKAKTLPYWNPVAREWQTSDEQLLVIEDREILLIPKSIVSPMNIYQMSKYKWHYVIESEQNFHLARRTALVKMRMLKSGKPKYYVTKKDVDTDISDKINSGDFKNTKEYLREYTQTHPDLFVEFVNDNKKKIKSLSNDKIVELISTIDMDIVIDKMIDKLQKIPTGRANANVYHYYVKSLLEVLWYPFLINPIIEKEIHDGRKRIDIVMDNNDNEGFFYKLHSIAKIYCPYVYIECKNYGKDVTNPEIDQLSGRFSPSRGQFGILVCRDLKNKGLFLKKCQDTYKDNRGLVICLIDDDIIEMLEAVKENDKYRIWSMLEDKKREIIIA